MNSNTRTTTTMNRTLRVAVLAALYSGGAQGQVVFDGTTGAAGAAPFDGSTYTIDQSRGTTVNTNLFHSFGTFNIAQNQTANFNGNANIQNIISRVTGIGAPNGLQPTNIDGTVRSSIAGANFWFVNPAGITVGSTGELDVSGALALGAADFVEFPNGLVWAARGPGADASTFTAAPSDFGFLPGSDAGRLTIFDRNFSTTAYTPPGGTTETRLVGSYDWLLVGGAGVTLQSQTELALTGGGKVESGRDGSVLLIGNGVRLDNARIYAPSGNIGIASVTDPSALVVTGVSDTDDFLFDLNSGGARQAITLSTTTPGVTAISTNSDAGAGGADAGVGGGIYLMGGQIVVEDAFLETDTLPGSAAGFTSLGIHADGASFAMARNASLTSIVRGREIGTVDNDGVLQTDPAQADSGPIVIRVTGDVTVDGSYDEAIGRNHQTAIYTQTNGGGNAGNIIIEADNLWMRGPSDPWSLPTVDPVNSGGPNAGTIFSGNNVEQGQDRTEATGRGGDIGITLRGDLIMSGLGYGLGPDPSGGNPAQDVLGVTGSAINSTTQYVGSVTDPDAGRAGNITIGARSLEMRGAGQISSGTDGSGSGGNIDIRLTGHLLMETDPRVFFTTGVFSSSRVRGQEGALRGTAGNLYIDVDSTLQDEGWVSISGLGSNGLGSRLLSNAALNQGVAGDVQLIASGNIDISDALIETNVADNSEADGGLIRLESGSLLSLRRTSVRARSDGARNAGNITVIGSGVLAGDRSLISADYQNAGGNPGGPGIIYIEATGASSSNPQNVRSSPRSGVVAIIDSGVTANNVGGEDATERGEIQISGNDVVVAGGVVTTDVNAAGVGDRLLIDADRGVWLLRSTGTGFPSTLGLADPRDGDVRRSLVSSRTQASAAQGGRVEILAGSSGVTVVNSNIDTSTQIDGSNDAAGRQPSSIDVTTSGELRFNGAVVRSETTGIDTAGNVTLTGESVYISGGEISAATRFDSSVGNSQGVGNAGNVSVIATGASGPTGPALRIDAGALLRSDATQAQLARDANGNVIQIANAGTVAVTAEQGAVEIDFGTLNSAAGDEAGQAGTVTIDGAAGVTLVDTTLNTAVATARSQTLEGLDLLAASIEVSSGGGITLTNSVLQSETSGGVDAGTITLRGDSLSIVGGRTPSNTAGQPANTAMTSSTTSTGNAGSIDIEITGLIDVDGASLLSRSESGGNAGNITIEGSGILIGNQSLVTTDYQSSGGRAGAISIDARGMTSSPAPQDTRDSAANGVLSIVDSAVTSNNVGGNAGAGAGGPEGIRLSGDDVVLAGAVVTSDVSAGGIGENITIAADNGVWILDSAGAGYQGEVVYDPRGQQRRRSLVSARTQATAQQGGQIDVTAGDRGVTIVGSNIDTSTQIDAFDRGGTASNIDLQSQTGTVTLSDAVVNTQTSGTDQAGEIRISGTAVSVTSGSRLSAATTGSGSAGDIELTATGAAGALIDGSTLSSDASEGSSRSDGTNLRRANAGEIRVVAQSGALTVTGATTLESDAGEAAGQAGEIYLSGSTGVSVTGGLINTSVATDDPEAPGLAPARIRFDSDDAVTLSGVTVLAESAGGVDAGAIMLSGTTVALDGKTSLTARTSGTGDAGEISLLGQTVTIADSTLTASTISAGNAGNIDVRTLGGAGTDSLRILEGARLSSTATSLATGNAGFIGLRADVGSVLIEGGSEISTSAVSSAGQAGVITVDAGQDITTDGAELTTSVATTSASEFTPALISLRADRDVTLTSTTIDATTSGAVDAGIITISGRDVRVTNRGISVETSGAGNAGQIALTASRTLALSNTTLSSESTNAESGAAGSIALTGGTVAVTGGGIVTSTDSQRSGLNAARIAIVSLSGATTLAGVDVETDTSGATDAGDIVVSSTGALSVGGSLTAATTSTGDAGRVELSGQSVSLTGADVLTTTSGSGNANAITVTTSGALSLSGGSLIASTQGAGDAGAIRLDGQTVTVNGARVESSTRGTGAAGGIDINSASALTVSGGAQLVATTSATGTAGSIDLRGQSVALSGARLETSTTGTQSAGSIALSASSSAAEAMRVESNSVLASTASAATGPDSNAGSITLTTPGGMRIADSEITTAASANAGHAGVISVNAGQNIVVDGASLRTTVAASNGALPAANITVLAGGAISMVDSDLDASTSGAVDAGNIQIRGDSILLDEGTTISSTTSSGGSAGNICIHVTGACNASGAGSAGQRLAQAATMPSTGGITLQGASLTTSTSGAGAAGSIEVLAAGPLSVLGGSSIVSNSTGTGAGGSIALQAGPSSELSIVDSTIATSAERASGGSILIDAAGSPTALRNAQIIASAGAAGTGGDITMNALGDTFMQKSVILAQAEQGNGGAINIYPVEGAEFLRDSESVINADSDTGNDGEINLDTPDTDIDAAIKAQEVELAAPLVMAASSCSPKKTTDRSTFVRETRGGISESPDGYLSQVGNAPPAAKVEVNVEGEATTLVASVGGECR